MTEIIKYIIDYSSYPILNTEQTEIIGNNKRDFIEYLDKEFNISSIIMLSIITLKENFIDIKIENNEENDDE